VRGSREQGLVHHGFFAWFGRVWAEAALERGDRVAATARNVGSLDGLVGSYGGNVLPLALDVTGKKAAEAAVRRAHDHFGRWMWW
jgi:NADP-dependent 3-hydroxy acid dehydrogenase YdfG